MRKYRYTVTGPSSSWPGVAVRLERHLSATMSRPRTGARLYRNLLEIPMRSTHGAARQASQLGRGFNAVRSLGGSADAPGMLPAPRRGVDDRRAAVHDRTSEINYPAALTGMMIEQRHGAEIIGYECRIGDHGGGQWRLRCRFCLPRRRHRRRCRLFHTQFLGLAPYGIETSPRLARYGTC
jgi:hypothetical protein